MKNKRQTLVFSRAFDTIETGEDPNVLTFSVASSEPCLRQNKKGPYYEILEITEDSVNTERLNSKAAPLLLQHDDDDQIGIIENAYIQDGKVYVTARFSKNPGPQEILSDIKDGIRRNVSIGYTIDESVMVKSQDFEYPVEMVKRFTIYECSIVSAPADPKVGIGRSMESEDEAEEEKEEQTAEPTEEAPKEEEKAECPECGNDPCTCEEKEKACDEEETKEQPENESKACDEEEKKSEEAETEEAAKDCDEGDAEEIRSLAELMNCRDLGETFITEKKSYQAFKEAVRNNMTNKETKSTMENTQKFSLRKAILNLHGELPDSECEFERSVIENNKRSLQIPNISRKAIVLTQKDIRGILIDGNEALNQPNYRPDLYESYLRAPVTKDYIGVTTVGAPNARDLEMVVAISGINAGYGKLNSKLVSGGMDFTLQRMTPYKCGAYVDISEASLYQDDPNIQSILLEDIVKAVNEAEDKAFFNGLSGNEEPIGLLNTPNVNEVTISGTPTLSNAMEFEKKIRESNNYSGNLKWVMGTDAYYQWATTPYSATEQNRMLIEDRKCIGYDVFVDHSLPTSSVILGDFSQALEVKFDALVIDVATDANLVIEGTKRLYAREFNDYCFRRPKSFTKRV
jgi:phage head maturation protease